MNQKVAKRLDEVLSMLKGKMETYLKLCKTTHQQLFLLNYFQNIFDSQTAYWFQYGIEKEGGIYFQYEDDDNRFYPSGLRWHEVTNPIIRKALAPLEYELHPDYSIIGETEEEEFKIDFAFFSPRTDNLGDKIKVAIDCGSEGTGNQIDRRHVKDRILQSKGWLIARFTGSEIDRKDIYDLIGEVEKLATNKDYEFFQESQQHRTNWKWN